MKRKALFLWMLAGIILTMIPGRASSQDQAEMVQIQAGEFIMGSDAHFGEGPAHSVYVDSFYLDRYEVTNRQYCRFLNDMGNQMEGGVEWLNLSDCGIEYRDGEYFPKPGYENHPVVRATWYGAKAYAEWRACRLPTEAEWEKAVRGGFEGKTYYWGEEIDPAKANYGQDSESTTPVGSYPPNGYGLYDMTGNVWEWCNDWYARDYYSRSPYKNPRGPEEGHARTVRGGGWSGPVHVYAKYLRCSFRYFLRPESTNIYLGFRCAKSADK